MDTSEAIICVKIIHSYGDSVVNLLASISILAPLYRVTILQLEDCASVLLIKLMQKFLRALKHEFYKINFWKDSTILPLQFKKIVQRSKDTYGK